MRDCYKISFTGDIMCEKPLQRYAEKHGFSSFSNVFENTKVLFAESDYVVGNLETVFGGEQTAYTRELYKFNTPDAFADALSQSGIHMVTTATNHGLDCGVPGLIRTISVLDQVGVEHTGTFVDEKDAKFLVKQFGCLKVAFVNYTYGTNVHESKVVLAQNELFHLNMLKPQTFNLQTYMGKKNVGRAKKLISGILTRLISTEQKIQLKKSFNLPYNTVRIDHLDYSELDETYLERIKEDIKAAHQQADFVIVCIHSGGQFNSEPGDFTKFITRQLSEYGADAVIGNHPHVVQGCKKEGDTFVAYSLGNYSISPSSVYLIPDGKPEYSIALHIYISSSGVEKITFSILKIVESDSLGLTVYPVDELYEKMLPEERTQLLDDVRFIHRRFAGRELVGSQIQREFIYYEND